MIEEGMKAPDFALPAVPGDTATLADHAGRYLVVYFYPKDDTPGCTTEAGDFTSLADEFAALNADIIGISRDSPSRHAAFRDKRGLSVRLASDEDARVCDRFGVWVEKNMYGRKYMGIQRATFIIGPDGTVLRVWPKVRVKGHAADVLKALRSLANEPPHGARTS